MYSSAITAYSKRYVYFQVLLHFVGLNMFRNSQMMCGPKKLTTTPFYQYQKHCFSKTISNFPLVAKGCTSHLPLFAKL